RSCGYTVLCAPEGAGALQLAAEHREGIDMLLTDVVMPGGMNGTTLAAVLAEQRPSLKVLFMSGYTTDTVVRHGVLAAGTPFLQKPFGPDALTAKVREVLDA